MAKAIGPSEVIIKNDMHQWVFSAENPILSSTNGGETHQVSLGELHNYKRSLNDREVKGFSIDDRALCDPEPTKAERMLEELVIKAQIIEIEGLEAAYDVDKALKEERRRNAKASHEFNMAVLAYLHAGGTEDAAVAKLEELNLGFPEQVEEVANLDLDALYSLGRED